MPMSSGLSSEGHSSSRAPKAPRSRARLRVQQVAENAQTEAAPAEAVQSQSAQSQAVKASATKVEAPQAEAQPTGATQTNAAKPAVSAPSEASAQAVVAQPAVAHSAATQPSSSARHMPRKPVVHKSHSQNGAVSSASKSAAAVHASAQSLKDSVRSALMTGRTVSEVEHPPELFDVEAFEDSSSQGGSVQTASSQSVKSAEKEVANQKATQKSAAKKSSAGSAESREESAAQKAQERADKSVDKAGEKAAEEPRPASRFGRWRAEREQQRAARACEPSGSP